MEIPRAFNIIQKFGHDFCSRCNKRKIFGPCEVTWGNVFTAGSRLALFRGASLGSFEKEAKKCRAKVFTVYLQNGANFKACNSAQNTKFRNIYEYCNRKK